MKSNFLLKSLMVFIFLPHSFGLIVGMTDIGSGKRSVEHEGLIRSPNPLIGIVSLQIAKQATQIYDKQGYAAFVNYVNVIPEEVKVNLIFCALINFLNRSDIFITQLKAIYKESKEKTFHYFSQFCLEGQQTIFYVLTKEKNLDKELIRYLINNIKNINLLSYLYFLFPSLKGKRVPRLSKKARARLRAFKQEITDKLKIKFEIFLKDIKKRHVAVKFSDKICKIAPELMALAIDDLSIGSTNFIVRFSQLKKEAQIEFLKYLFLRYALENISNTGNALTIYHNWIIDLANINDRDEQFIKQEIDNHFEILSQLDEIYPEQKTFRAYSFAQSCMYTCVIIRLLQNIDFLVTKLLIKLLKESKIKESLDLLYFLQNAFAKLNDRENEYKSDDSIFLNFFKYLLFPADSITTAQAGIYFKNLYKLFKESIEPIKHELKQLMSKEEKLEFEILYYFLNSLIIWFNSYLIALKQQNLATAEELKQLTQDFKKEVLEKFESQS